MTVLAVQAPETVISGEGGWHAEIYHSHTIIKVAPQGDGISAAVAQLVPAEQLRLWTLEWVYQTDAGWDVYVFEHTG